SWRELFGRHLITIEHGAADSIQPTGLDSHNETWLQTVKPPISIHRRRALAGPEASPWTIPWNVVHRRMPLVDRPHVRLMPKAARLRDVGMEDSDRWVFGVVVKPHPDLTAVVGLDNDRVQQRGRLQRARASESLNAGPVCCNGWFGWETLNVLDAR